MNDKIDQAIHENAQKFIFLAREYPKKTLEDLTQLMSLPGIDVNLAIWHAVDQGWMIDPADTEGNDPYVHLSETLPQKWEFGESVDELAAKVVKAFHVLTKKETDLQWEFLSAWLMGYTARDTLIVLKHMLAEGTIEKYSLTDPEDIESVYEFYTLPENRKNLWGAKSFKIQPTEETVVSEDEEINEPAADDAAESEK